jgi:hypothetical protein
MGTLGEADPRTHARRNDPATSHLAAARLSPKHTILRALLEAFTDGPLTADEAAMVAGYAPAAGTWRRVSDLSGRGLVEDTGQTRMGTHGRPQMVRAITAAGWAALGRNDA